MTSYTASHPRYRELVAENMRLIEPDLQHASESLSWIGNIDIVAFMGADFPSPTLEGEYERLQKILASTDEYSWMIECDGKVIGNVCINTIAETTQKCGMRAGNLTILIGDKNYWQKGIGNKACSAVVEWAFSDGGFVVITARALQENVASIKTLQKLGFTETGTGTESYGSLVHGKPSSWRNFRIEKMIAPFSAA